MKKLVMLCLSLCMAGAAQAQEPATPLPYQNAELSPDQRADDLLKRLTLEEKVTLMQNNSKAIPRLGIKPYEWWNEALHGVARAGLATVFPQSIGMAASFDDDLLYKVFDAVSDEARAKNRMFNERGSYRRYQGLTFWTPNVNIFRDPRWGRGQETYGEDPYLSGQMGMAVVRGLQGPNDTKWNKTHACAKHFAVHSGPEWCRHSFNAENIPFRELWETYLPAFKDLVQKAGVKEVMCAYNRFEGDPCCGSDRLLHQILRNEWGFDGIVVTDCGAVSDFWQKHKHGVYPDAGHASAAAVANGTDLECGSNFESLVDAVRQGLVPEEKINNSVRRLLKARFELGEMEPEHPFADIPDSIVDCQAHRALALQMARETMVLLQNKKNVLPLKPNATVAVVGPNANDSVMQWANYNGTPSHTVTLLKALRQRLPEGKVIYEQICGHTEGYIWNSLFPACSIDGKRGFAATYWNNREAAGEVAATDQVESPFHFSGEGSTAFAAGVNLKDFTGRYVTTFRPDHAGKAHFRLMTNGRVKFFLDGKQVCEQYNIKNPANVYIFPFESGKEYRIELTFEQVKDNPFFNFDLVEEGAMDMKAILKRLKKADVVIFAGGISPLLEGEAMSVAAEGFKGGDRTTIELPRVQREVMAALKQAGKKVVMVNFSGSAMGLKPETESCDAILQAWYPGQEGGTAIAEVLFGDYNPAGRLPVTFYESDAQLPDFLDYHMAGRTYRYFKGQPLFVFGYGMSYTTFEYGDATADRDTVAYGETVRLRIPVTNTGKRDGDEVVQVYLRRPGDTEGPLKALRGFRRVNIAKGETCEVEIELPYENFQWFDTASNSMHPMEGVYEVLYGGSSRDEDLKTLSVTVE